MASAGGRRRPIRAAASVLLAVSGVAMGEARPSLSASAHVDTYELVRSWGTNGVAEIGLQQEIREIHPLADGSTLVLLRTWNADNTPDDTVIKLRPDGSRDMEFAAGSATPGTLRQVDLSMARIVVRRDGRFLFGIRQYTADGELDLSFGDVGWIASQLGVRLSGPFTTLFETANGSLVLTAVGDLSPASCYVMPVSSAGVLQVPYPVVPVSCLTATAVPMRDGSTVVIAQDIYGSGDANLLVFDADGNLDPAFGSGTGVVRSEVLDLSGGIAATSTSTNQVVVLVQDGAGLTFAVRVNRDGSVDDGFGYGEFGFQGYGESLAIDGDDHVTIAVDDALSGVDDQASLLRLTPRGFPDQEFNRNGAVPGYLSGVEFGVPAPSGASQLALTPSGDLLVGLGQPALDAAGGLSWHSVLALLHPVQLPAPPGPPQPPPPGPPALAASFVPVTPERLLDTRATEEQGGYQAGGRPTAGATVKLRVTLRGAAHVPADASAVALNVTGVDAAAPGFVTVWPCGTPRPLASNLNLVPGEARANLVISGIGEFGEVCLYTMASADLVVDISGWFPKGSSYHAVTPERLLETRPDEGPAGGHSGPAVAGTVVELQVTERGAAAIPSTASAVSLNVTGVGALTAGFVTVWPCGAERPLASSLNLEPAEARANLVVTAVGVDGEVCLFTSTTVDLVADVNGWFADGSSYHAMVPQRLLETRLAEGQVGYAGPRPRAGDVVRVQVARATVAGGRPSVPLLSAAVVLTVTVVDAAQSGYLTAWPCDHPRPPTSNLNLVTSRTTPNVVISELDPGGGVCLYVTSRTDLLVDVAGWFAATA